MGVLIALAGVTGIASVALAAPPPHSRSSRDDVDYASVRHVEPIVRQVRIETPRRECYDDVRYVEESPSLSNPQVGGRALLGGIIGGVLGHQIGSGSGRDAARVAGAVIGAGIGYNAGRRAVGTGQREEVVQRCDTRVQTEYEERIEGYRVTYEYAGRQYTTRMPYDPGERIRVRVAVAPAE